jgi:hypothetical protein
MIWINFLHFYQPANIDARFIVEATRLCYERVASALEKNPNIRFTININGSLLLRWEELGCHKLIERYKNLVARGQVELTGTACYHPLLPLIEEAELIKQIEENRQLLNKFFGSDLLIRGFFLPEMAYSKKVGQAIKSQGYEWIILDEIAHDGKLDSAKTDQVYLDSSTGLKVVFRSRQHSNTFVPDTILNSINTGQTIVTATDGEIYGLRHLDHDKRFEQLLANPQLSTKKISEFIDTAPKLLKTNCRKCSWDSTPIELEEGLPYILWANPKNLVHKKLWRLAKLAHAAVSEYENDKNKHWSRWHLVRGLASCTFWWASDRNFSQIYGPRAWNPDEIVKGVNELVRAIRSIDDRHSLNYKIQAEKYAAELSLLVWQKHWESHWHN